MHERIKHLLGSSRRSGVTPGGFGNGGSSPGQSGGQGQSGFGQTQGQGAAQSGGQGQGGTGSQGGGQGHKNHHTILAKRINSILKKTMKATIRKALLSLQKENLRLRSLMR